MATHGAFTDGEARISARGGVPRGEGKNASFTDTYTFTLAEGERPTLGTVEGIPEPGDETAGLSGYEVKTVNFRQDDPRSLVWFADVVHGRKTSTSSTVTIAGRVVSRSWGSRIIQRDMTVDAQGVPVRLPSLDLPFESVPEQSLIVPCITIKRQEKHSPAQTIADYSGTVNETEIAVAGFTIPAHQGRITITGEDGPDEEYPYDVTYQIDIMHNRIDTNQATLEYCTSGTDYEEVGTYVDLGWDVALLACSFYYIATGPDSTEVLRFYDNPNSNGVRADGTNIDPDSPGIDPAELQPSTSPFPVGIGGEDRRDGGTYSLVFQPYPEMDWSGLNLPAD